MFGTGPGLFNVIVVYHNNKMNIWDSDIIVQQWLQENDDTSMPIPNIESEPHLLISKVRKHYMEYVIKLLAVNYEKSQKLLNKNIYLPSAIWRCAKLLEMTAARSCMVVQLYRQNIITVIKELKEMTKKGKLYKQLYACLRIQPTNEKKTQANMVEKSGCICQCSCGRKKNTLPSDIKTNSVQSDLNVTTGSTQSNIPQSQCSTTELSANVDQEMQRADDIMQQLEELFQGIPDDNDIFDGALDNIPCEKKSTNVLNVNEPKQQNNTTQDQSNLDKSLANISGILSNNIEPNSTINKNDKTKHQYPTKWLCEEYFLKVQLYEKLDEIREKKRIRHIKVKETIIDLFGYDSDGEGVVSPIDETPEFITSCKERIAPWVVKLLNPYYVKGRIRGRALFKSLVKHLIKLIYQCSKYPFEYEVQSFVQDFLESHKMIRCEADFQEFRIDNI